MSEKIVRREAQCLRVEMTLELSEKLTMESGGLLGWLAIAIAGILLVVLAM